MSRRECESWTTWTTRSGRDWNPSLPKENLKPLIHMFPHIFSEPPTSYPSRVPFSEQMKRLPLQRG